MLNHERPNCFTAGGCHEPSSAPGQARDNTRMPSTPAPTPTLRLEGATNFRDLGGLRTVDGRRVCPGRVFRSDHLAALTAADRAALQSIGLARSFDFRGVDERSAAAYALPGLTQHSLPIEPTVAQRMVALAASGQPLTAANMTTLMEELYERLADDPAQRYAQWFTHLLDGDGAPFVFHCTAGKDRTGVAAALLLFALGVPPAAVAHDFLLTNEFYRRPADAAPPATAIPEEALAVLWGVRASFLDAALAAIDARHGGIERYLARKIGLTPPARARLAALYLDE